MAQYTLELRQFVHDRNIFSFDYDFYDEKKRAEFEQNFIRHFYFREIGCDTVDRFIWYLEDKMKTVFPYYNELFKAANIEYSVLDNYNLTETYERTLDSLYKNAGVVSARGETQDNQTVHNETTQDDKTTTNNSNTRTYNEQEKFDGKVTLDGESKDTESFEGENTTTTTQDKFPETTLTKTGSESKEEVRKFLDTPQGKLNLENSDYLTTLNHDVTTTTPNNLKETTQQTGVSEVKVVESPDATKTIERMQDDVTTTDNTNSHTGTVGDVADGSVTLDGESKSDTTTDAKQTTINDSNTRSEHKGDTKEQYTLKKKGNIGVDTDADMIQKHINLQKVLRKIEAMFFDECEDLFMLVY